MDDEDTQLKAAQSKTTQAKSQTKKIVNTPEAIPATVAEQADQSFLDELKEEWNLFWASIKGDDHEDGPESDDPFVNGPYQDLNLEQVKDMKKSLSSDKKRLNQRLEALKKEMDMLSARIENLKMVGADIEETQNMLLELNDFGQSLSEQLNKLDRRIQQAREREQALKEQPTDI